MVAISEKLENINNTEETQEMFNPLVHVKFRLKFKERERLKRLAISKGVTLEKLLQDTMMKVLESD